MSSSIKLLIKIRAGQYWDGPKTIPAELGLPLPAQDPVRGESGYFHLSICLGE